MSNQFVMVKSKYVSFCLKLITKPSFISIFTGCRAASQEITLKFYNFQLVRYLIPDNLLVTGDVKLRNKNNKIQMNISLTGIFHKTAFFFKKLTEKLALFEI